MKVSKLLTLRVDELSCKLDSGHKNYEIFPHKRRDIYDLLKLNMWLLEIMLRAPEPVRVRYH